MKHKLFTLFLATCLFLSSFGKTPNQQVLERFSYTDVRLTTGDLRRQLDEVTTQYLAIADEDLLKGFRERAGLPAPGKDLGGWYSQGTWHAFGQYLSGLSRLYAATGNDACRKKVITLIEGWA